MRQMTKSLLAVSALTLAGVATAVAGGIRTDGEIETTAGGIRFPDATLQTTAAVEARMPISSAPFTITQSGSYYLTDNLSVASGDAITVSASDVNLDLAGFTISDAGSAGAAIKIDDSHARVTVRNGILDGFTYGIRGSTTTDGLFVDLVIDNDGDGTGIWLGHANTVRSCKIRNTAASGINVGDGNLVEDVTVTVASSIGITASAGNTVRESLIRESGNGNESSGHGIFLDGSRNLVEGNHVVGTLGNGITVAQLADSQVIRDNMVTGSTYRGIWLAGSSCVVKRNVVSDNGTYGVLDQGANNLTLQNIASDNDTADYSGTTSPTETDPWENLSH